MKILIALAFHTAIYTILANALPFPDDTENQDLENATDEAYFFDPTKDESLYSCAHFTIDPEDYVVYPNETAYLEAYNMTFDPAHYIILNGTLIICSIKFNVSDSVSASNIESDISSIGMGVSMVCMILHLIVFALVKDLRNLPGYNLASLCFSLLMAHSTFLIGNSIDFNYGNVACVVMASCSHFFFLASFMWSSVMAIDVYKSLLNATGKLRLASAYFSMKKFIFYSCYAWGVSLIIAVFTIIVDNTSFVPEEYRPMFGQGNYCWFTRKLSLLFYFALPVFIIIVINAIIFGLSAFTVCSNSMRTDSESQKTALNSNFKLYSRLAIIMGSTWVIGILASSVHTKWMWYLFIFLNAFQGLFIFVAFTCASKVRKHFKKMLGLDDRRPSTATTLTPTFQTYANSVDKDLDDIANGDKSVHCVVPDQ